MNRLMGHPTALHHRAVQHTDNETVRRFEIRGTHIVRAGINFGPFYSRSHPTDDAVIDCAEYELKTEGYQNRSLLHQ